MKFTLLITSLLATLMGCGSTEKRTDIIVPLRVESFDNLDRKFLVDPKEALIWDVKIKSKKRPTVERIKLAAFELTRLFESYSAVQGEELSIELTARKATNLGFLVATNSQEIAESTTRTKLIWQRDCEHVIRQEYVVGRPGSLNIKLCNVSGEFPKSTFTVQPSNLKETRHSVIYKCSFTPSSSNNLSLYTFNTTTPCQYGYAPLSEEAAPKMIVPSAYAPGTANAQSQALALERFYLKSGRSGPYTLDTDFTNLPFGSHTRCHTQKLDVKYSTPGGYQTTRLTFKRGETQNGSAVWMPQDSESWPSLESIARYYGESNNEKLTLYRICEWSTEGGSELVSIN